MTTNIYKGVRKVRKGQWVYDCTLCDTQTKPRTDLFGVMESKRAHLNGSQHTAKTLSAMGDAFVSAFSTFADGVSRAFKPAMEALDALYAPLPNTPHDPSLWNDKRKWGGR